MFKQMATKDFLKGGTSNSNCGKAIQSEKELKLKKIIELVEERRRNRPERTPEEIWQRFDAVWEKITNQS